MTPFFAGLCLLAMCVVLFAEARVLQGLRAAAKTIASASFVLFAWGCGALNAGPAGVWLVAGLLFAVAGDLFLLSSNKRWFLAGIGAFLLTHVCYCIAFCFVGLSWSVTAVALVPLGLLAWAIWRWLGPHVGNLSVPVRIYIVVISCMVAFSVGCVAAEPSPARAGLLVCAVLFFASDIMVARQRFVSAGFLNKLIGLPLYYVSQLGLAGWIASAGG